MQELFSMISGLWNSINNTIIYQDDNISFSLGTLLITFFLINIVVSFIHIIIVGSGDKTHNEFTVGRNKKE